MSSEQANWQLDRFTFQNNHKLWYKIPLHPVCSLSIEVVFCLPRSVSVQCFSVTNQVVSLLYFYLTIKFVLVLTLKPTAWFAPVWFDVAICQVWPNKVNETKCLHFVDSIHSGYYSADFENT